MTHKINDDFLEICKEILSENKTAEEWAEIESDDIFQRGNYEGGFDATGMTFCFSVSEHGKECWFEFPLTDVELFDKGEKKEVTITETDH
jgi:hypothetical protein